MNATKQISVLAVFAVAMLIIVAVIGAARDHSLPMLTLKLQQFFQAGGMIIAVMAALLLLVQAAGEFAAVRMVSCVIALFGGLCVAQPAWPAAAGLAVVAAAAVAGAVFEKRSGS
ncbi:MAG TPA: hypothetical protein VMN36_08000 [Verrucomicrobiales bacterium]|nr:hypothetical protein [Verrucomicrobiales bacterium]